MIRVALLGLLAVVLLPRTALASMPPPPPPTPKCGPCVGPPSPPTPVPTLGPSVNPTPVIVAVSLSPLKVHRGKWEKSTVKADKSAAVVLVVHYHSGKPVVFRGKVGSAGSYTKSWQVSKSAPLGKASLDINVQGSSPYRSTLTFTVIR